MGAASTVPVAVATTPAELFEGNNVQIAFRLCTMWHPRFRFPAFILPKWLKENYAIAHCRNDASAIVAAAVHRLFHIVLDNDVDRLHMQKAIAVGETLAILHTDNDNNDVTAVAAVTFAAIGNKAIVLFLAVDERYRKSGFGSQLMMMMGQCLMHRGEQNVCLFLFANQEDNKAAWSFYTRCGFVLAPDDFVGSIPQFVSNPDLGEFLYHEVITLKLLLIDGVADKFVLGPKTAAKSPLLFLLNPQRPMHGPYEDDMIYARFPADLSLAECNHCGKDLFLLRHADVFEDASATDGDGSVGICQGLPKSQFIVSWSSRAEVTTGMTVLNPTISMLLAWIQRDSRAKIWKERITMVPQCIMTPLWNMHFLLQRFLQSNMYKDENFEGIKNATFHPEFDNSRFLAYSKVVLEFILSNRDDLFVKPYIAMFGENLTMDWTCFISVNAGSIGSVSETHQVGEPVCGFIHYNPLADDGDFRCSPILGDDPYLFFLTLAYHVLKSEDEAVGFNDVAEFLVFFNHAEFSFGEPYEESLNERSSFNGSHSFVHLALPTKFPLRLLHRMEHLSKIASILFFLDFCVSVADDDFYWQDEGWFGISTMPLLSEASQYAFEIPSVYFPFGATFDYRQTVWKATMRKKNLDMRSRFGKASGSVVNTFLSSLVVLIDRIASSRLGTRKSEVKYKRLLANRGRNQPDLTSLPLPGVRFTDRSHVLNWVSLPTPAGQRAESVSGQEDKDETSSADETSCDETSSAEEGDETSSAEEGDETSAAEGEGGEDGEAVGVGCAIH